MFHLPVLPYDFNALGPIIDAKTMQIHYEKHHGTYVDKLNVAVVVAGLEDRGIEDLLENIDTLPIDAKAAIKNHGGGHHNHSIFWNNLSPTPGDISDKLKIAIDNKWGSLDKLVNQMQTSGAALFGSGWVWLVAKDGELSVINRSNQDSPLMTGYFPLLGIDVWEHAYYLNYKNKRADYLKEIFKIVDWDMVSARYDLTLEEKPTI